MRKAELKIIILIAAVILFYSALIHLGIMEAWPFFDVPEQSEYSYRELIDQTYLAIIFTLCLLLFVIHFTMFIFYPQGRENLFYSLALILWLISYLGYKNIINTYIMVYPFAFLFVLRFIYCFTHPKPPKYFWLIVLFVIGLEAYFSLNFYLSGSLSQMERFIGNNALRVFDFFIAFEVMRALICSAKKYVAGYWFIFIAGVAFSTEVITRQFHFFNFIVLPEYTREWNISIFMIMVSLFLAYRFAMNHKTLEQLNEDLEQRVRNRTAELEEANEELRELDKTKSAFVSQASHDLRTPLTSIKSSLDNLVRGVGGGLSERQGQVVGRALKSVNRLTNLINDVLDINRIESGRMVLEKSLVQMESIVKNVIQENQPFAQQKNISINASGLDQSIPIEVDGGKIERVINELVNNAIKYTLENGSIEILLSQSDTLVQFSVKDNGIGLTKEDCTNIFERFYRVEDAKMKAKGSGLGLSIAKELVEMHGGKIDVESEPNKGTKFTLIL